MIRVVLGRQQYYVLILGRLFHLFSANNLRTTPYVRRILEDDTDDHSSSSRDHPRAVVVQQYVFSIMIRIPPTTAALGVGVNRAERTTTAVVAGFFFQPL